jgi:spore germination protein KB
MDRNIISDKQGIALMALFLWGSTLIFGAGGHAKKDMWFAILLGMVISMIIHLMYCSIINAFPSLSIFEINERIFGRFAGKVLNIVYILIAFYIAALVLNNFAEFIAMVGLPDTPKFASILPIALLCIWGIKCGIEVLARCAEFFIVLLLTIMFFSTTLSIPSMQFNNIRPLLKEGIKPIAMGALSAISFPFTEAFVFLMLAPCLKNKKSIYKVFLFGTLICGVTVATFALRNTLVIGQEMMSKSYSPSYSALSRINVGEFIQRIEMAVTVSFLLTGFIKISVCIQAVCTGLAHFLKLDKKEVLVTPVSLSALATSFIVYESIIEAAEFTRQISPYYKIIFQVFVPLLTYLGIKIRGSKIKDDT